MSSESGQRLPMEELKRRNAPPSITPQSCPSKEEWENLLLMIRALHRLTAEQSNTLENLNQHIHDCKQSFHAEVITCPGYISKRSETVTGTAINCQDKG